MNPRIDKPEGFPKEIEDWLASIGENCKRMYQDESYRKEVAKRQF